MGLACFGPWARALIVTVAGVEGDGIFVLGGAALALGLLWKYAHRGSSGIPVVTALIGVGGAAVAIINLQDIQSIEDAEFFGQTVNVAEPGWGIYATTAAAISLVVVSIALRREAQQAQSVE